MTVTCCGEEMLIAERYYHCLKCGMKFIRLEYEDGKQNDRRIVAMLLTDILADYIRWKDFQHIMHEIWREATYEDYEGNYPEEWFAWKEKKDGAGK